MEGLGAGAPGARGTPKRPREEEEDPRQQEWEEYMRQQAAAGWPELDPRLENHAADNDDAWSDAPTEPWGDDGADPDCQHTIDAPDDATVSELEQAWQRAGLQTRRWQTPSEALYEQELAFQRAEEQSAVEPSDDDDPDVPDDDDPDVPDDASDAPTEPWLSEGE